MIHPVQLKKYKKLATLVAVFGLSLTVAGCGATSPPVTPVVPDVAPVAALVKNVPVPTPAPAPTPVVKQPAKENAPVSSPTPARTAAAAPAPVAVVSTYKDGIYSATGNYGSPAGAESIGVMITLKNDVIADAAVEAHATNPRSKIMQADFVANYKPLVIGKKIDEVRLTKVSGSSLTSAGFNEALAKIKAQAT